MNPAFSVIFLTTLIGVGQGLFIVVVLGQPYSGETVADINLDFMLLGSAISLLLLGLGLFASFFHLGRPERAWRAATKWRTSWLSREVIVLPIAMLIVFCFGMLRYFPEWGSETIRNAIGWAGVAAMILLYICTGMIYACIKFLQEWATPWTLINFGLLGIAAGLLLASALAATVGEPAVRYFIPWTLAVTTIAMLARLFSFYRNSQIKSRSSMQTAIGIRHQKITQRSMGFTGGSFNTRAFFHHCTQSTLRNMRTLAVTMVFVIPIVMICGYIALDRVDLLWVGALVQYIGLIADRWLFFAQANHPQNLYYQTIG